MSSLQKNLELALDTAGLPSDYYENRHPSTQHMIKVLAPNPNLAGPLYDIAEEFFSIGSVITSKIEDGPELTAGLRKLVEAKDCFVRGYLDNSPVDYRDR